MLDVLGRRTAPSGPASSSRDAGEDGANEFVFYDGPPFANGLPHYGHLLTGYVKDVVPRYQTMRGRRVERRFGWDTHGLPAELEAMTPARHQDQGRDRRAGHREVQRRLPRRRCCSTPTSGATTSPARPAGSTSTTTTRRSTSTTWSRCMWAFKTLLRQGPGLRGLPRAALLLERRDAAVQPRAADGRRRLPDAAGPGGHRRAAGCETGELRRWSGRRRRGRCRPTWRSWSARTSTTSWSSPTAPARPSATSSPRPGSRRYARELRRGRDAEPGRRAAHGRRPGRPRATRRRSTYYARARATRTGCSRADFVTTEDGTGLVHIAPALR